MKFLKMIILTIALLLGINSTTLFAKTLHCVFAVDLQERLTKEGCEKDLESMCRHMERIAKAYSNETPVFYKMTGDKFSVNRLIKVLEGIQAKENDIIVFYYSGHGLWDDKKGLILKLREQKNLALSQVEEIIRKKKVRLKMVITDACKKEIKDRGRGFPDPLATIDKIDENYRELLSYEGYLRATSCQRGQESYSSQNGSYFTLAFLNAITFYVGKDFVSWDAIRARTIEQTTKMVDDILRIQEPDIDTSQLKRIARR